jgi:trimeric autotransporter adhesin
MKVIRNFIVTVLLGVSSVMNGQDIDLWQLKYAPDSTFVIGADTTGEPKWVKKPNGKTYKSNNPIIITASDTIKINKADGITNGYLSSTDWSIFNNKIDTVSITTDQAGYFITKNANKYTLNLPYTENNTSMRIGLDSKLGTNSLMIGNNAGSISGFNNVGLGKDVLKLAGSTGSGGSNNVGLGAFTMSNLTSGIDNASLGASSLAALTTGVSNVAVGTVSLIAITTGSDNTSVGRGSSRVTTGSANTVMGSNAWFNGIGSNNTILGSQAASNMDGSHNNYIGYQSGFNNDGSNNTSLGSGSMAFATNISNSLAIGSNAGRFLDRENSLIIHNSWQSTGLITGQFDNMRIGINRNVNSINSTLHVGGDVIVDSRSGQGISIAGYEANGRLGSITLGSNLSISSGQLNATVPSYSQGTGINITSGIISNTGDLSNSNEIQDIYPISMGFALSNPTLNLQDSVIFNYQNGVSSGFQPASNYVAGTGINITGNTISSTVINTDNQNLSISGNAIGISGGSGINLSSTTPTSGQVLTYNGSAWTATTISSGSTTIQESINTSTTAISTSVTTICDISLGAGTWKVDAVHGFQNLVAANLTVQCELVNVGTGAVLFSSSEQCAGLETINISLSKVVTLTSTTTIRLRASTSNGNGRNNQSIITAIK